MSLGRKLAVGGLFVSYAVGIVIGSEACSSVTDVEQEINRLKTSAVAPQNNNIAELRQRGYEVDAFDNNYYFIKNRRMELVGLIPKSDTSTLLFFISDSPGSGLDSLIAKSLGSYPSNNLRIAVAKANGMDNFTVYSGRQYLVPRIGDLDDFPYKGLR